MKYDKFTLDQILHSSDIAIHVPTQKASDKLFKLLAKKLPTSIWVTPPNWWERYKKDSTYYVGASRGQGDIEYSLEEKDFIVSVYSIIGFGDDLLMFKYLI